MECKHCGNNDCNAFYIEDRGNQKALMCGKCGKWQKWVGKKDLRGLLGMGVQIVKQENQINFNNINTSNIKNTHNEVLKCSVCGSENFEKKQVSIHTGLYCAQCGRWIKWIKKG